MDPATIVALVSTIVAAVIAIAVPRMTFRFALRQDQARWLREQRAALYVDMLTEANAEQQYLTWAMADDEIRDRMREHFQGTDTRLLPADRARLGARGTIFGSQAVNRLFNQLQAEGSMALLKVQPDEGDRIRMRVTVGDLFDKLQAQIRRELGADTIGLDGGPSVGGGAARR